MKVCYARDIFRSELKPSLRTMQNFNQGGCENIEKLCDFLEYFWRWYNYLDVVIYFKVGYLSKAGNKKKPFSEEDDPRLMIKDFKILQSEPKERKEETNNLN
jgi:hypothetical protein